MYVLCYAWFRFDLPIDDQRQVALDRAKHLFSTPEIRQQFDDEVCGLLKLVATECDSNNCNIWAQWKSAEGETNIFMEMHVRWLVID